MSTTGPSQLTPIGWLCFTGWQSGLVGCAFLSGTIIQGLIALDNPLYGYERWHGTLLVISITSFTVFFNTFLAKRLPLVEGLVLVLHIVGLFAIMIPLWILAPRNNSRAVFTEFTNNGGWATTGTSFMIGLQPLVVSVLGFDSSVHMCKSL
jgi:amino acid transporter